MTELMSIESVMTSNHLIILTPSSPALSLSQHQGLFQWVSSSHQVPKYWSFSFSISPSKEYSGWFPLGLSGLIFLLSKGLSRVFSSPTVWGHLGFISSQLLNLFCSVKKKKGKEKEKQMFIPWKCVNYLLYWTSHFILCTHFSPHSFFNSEKFAPKHIAFSVPISWFVPKILLFLKNQQWLPMIQIKLFKFQSQAQQKLVVDPTHTYDFCLHF